MVDMFGPAFRYLCMKWKKTVKTLPKMFLQAILLMALIGMIAFCGVKLLEKEPLAVRADIAVVMKEENLLTQMALGYVEGMESVSAYCNFVTVSEEEGKELLSKGEAAALVVLPKQLVESVLDGKNPTVEIYFPARTGLEEVLFRELAEAGAGLLRVAQAEIYGACDTAVKYDKLEELSVMEAEINSYNLAFALDRLALFESEEVFATGRLNTVQHYAASGIVMFLLFSGMALYPLMQPDKAAFRQQLKRHGVSLFWQEMCRLLCGLFGMCAALAAAAIIMTVFDKILSGYGAGGSGMFAGELFRDFAGQPGNMAGAQSRGQVWLVAGLALVTATAFICLIYSLADNRVSGILILFLVSVGMLFLSGGIVPSMFLPESVQSIGAKLPTGYLLRAAGGLMTGDYEGGVVRCAAGLIGYFVLFMAGAGLCRGK